ncbi:MAG: pantoate--beta-alanine ligase, partial [Methylococcales bacterium]
TVRESDGLALSSRNAYLSGLERQLAPLLYQSLVEAEDQIKNGRRDWDALEKEQMSSLESLGFKVDFFSICSADTLLPATSDNQAWVILVAAALGQTRLIDNIQVLRSDL